MADTSSSSTEMKLLNNFSVLSKEVTGDLSDLKFDDSSTSKKPVSVVAALNVLYDMIQAK